MTYAKPELVALTHAVEAIQGTSKEGGAVDDPNHQLSAGAYEADE